MTGWTSYFYLLATIEFKSHCSNYKSTFYSFYLFFCHPQSLNVISNSSSIIFIHPQNAAVAILSVVKSSLHNSLCMFFICPVFPPVSHLSLSSPLFLLQCFPFCYQVICCCMFPCCTKLFLVFALCQSSDTMFFLFVWVFFLKN